MTVIINLIVAVALAAYVRNAIRTRAAVGLWWDFLRDEEPIRYWTWLALMTFVTTSSIWSAVEMASGLRGQ
jgi:hypothetical protein